MANHTDERRAETEPTSAAGLNVGAIVMVGVVSIVLLIVVAIASQAWFYDLRDTRIAQEQYPQRNVHVQAYRAEQRRLLSVPRWLNEERTRAAIPIDRAMEMYAGGGIR